MTATRASNVERNLWIASIWLAIALFEATQTVFGMHAEGMQHNWGALFATVLLSWLPWPLITPLALRLGRRDINPATCLMHGGVAVAVNAVSSAWVAWLTVLLNPYATSPGPGPFRHVWFSYFFSGLLSSLMLYAAIPAVGY